MHLCLRTYFACENSKSLARLCIYADSPVSSLLACAITFGTRRPQSFGYHGIGRGGQIVAISFKISFTGPLFVSARCQLAGLTGLMPEGLATGNPMMDMMLMQRMFQGSSSGSGGGGSGTGGGLASAFGSGMGMSGSGGGGGGGGADFSSGMGLMLASQAGAGGGMEMLPFLLAMGSGGETGGQRGRGVGGGVGRGVGGGVGATGGSPQGGSYARKLFYGQKYSHCT